MGRDFFGFVRNNNINHNIKQKPLRGGIVQARSAQSPTCGRPASSGRSRQLARDSSSSHADGGGGEQIQEDGCRDSGLEMLVLTLSG